MNILTTIHTFDTLESTNQYLKDNYTNYTTGDVIVARSQTGGYGTQGRHWSSAKDKGLYFSILLKHRLDYSVSSNLTTVVVSAIQKALSTIGVDTTIHLPNDLLVDNKKISGVLTETMNRDSMYISIIGVGLNVNQSLEDFNLLDKRNTPTSIKLELGYDLSIYEVLDLVLESIDKDLSGFINNS